MEINTTEITNPFLMLRTSRGIELLDISSIIRIEASSNYSKLYFNNGKTLVVSKVLKWFDKNLPITDFIRVHKKFLVNKKFILKYTNVYGGHVKLITGDMIDVSRRKRTFVLQFLYNRQSGLNNVAYK